MFRSFGLFPLLKETADELDLSRHHFFMGLCELVLGLHLGRNYLSSASHLFNFKSKNNPVSKPLTVMQLVFFLAVYYVAIRLGKAEHSQMRKRFGSDNEPSIRFDATR